MNMRERQYDERDRPAPPAPTSAESSLRRAEELLAQGADAIERGLSQDSAAFLAANRQQGGE